MKAELIKEKVVRSLGPTVTVDPEFRALIPPVTDGERATLEASLLGEECRDALRWSRNASGTRVSS